MKIAIMCPGSWTYGLNSPERGEGRWAQNYSRMLAMAGHEVYAASMGRISNQKEDGVNLIYEPEVSKYGPYDIYIDSAWWQNKEPKGKASKYIIFKWSLESYTRDILLDDNFYIGHPYPCHQFEFTKGLNAQKSFCLPTMFGTKQEEPKWFNEKIFLPGKIDTNRDYKKFIPAISKFLSQYPVEGCSRSFFEKELEPGINFNRSGSAWYDLRPYNEVLESMRRSKLSLPILNPGAIIEAAFQGIPSIFWEHGGFYNPLAQSLDVLIPSNAEPQIFTDMAEMMMGNKKRYHEVIRGTQDYFSCHLYQNALKYFDIMVDSIF